MTLKPEAAVRKPNFLWICTDQQRYDTIEALNNPHIRTPNLNKLCQEGVAFTRAYCQSPICTPSRASFLTGLYPSTVHAVRNGIAHFPATEKLLPRRLADAGYHCGLIGKLHLAAAFTGREKRGDDGYTDVWYSHGPYHGADSGNDYQRSLVEQGYRLDDLFVRQNGEVEKDFSHYSPSMPPACHQTTWCVDRAIDFIADQAGHHPDRPWLLSINMFDPHPPFDAPQAVRERYSTDEIPEPLFRESDLANQQKLQGVYHQTRRPKAPDAQIMDKKASYYAMIDLIDEQLGRLFEQLEALGLRDNTVIVFMSDHGEALGDHGLIQKGCRFNEGGVRVPLIVSCPQRFVSGESYDGLIELTDIAPTLAELAGIPLPNVHGKSLLPLLEGRSDQFAPRTYAYSEYFDCVSEYDVQGRLIPTVNPSMGTMYTDGDYKLIIYHNVGLGELYDLKNDPDEFANLWDDPNYAAIRADLMLKSYNLTIMSSDMGPEKIHPF